MEEKYNISISLGLSKILLELDEKFKDDNDINPLYLPEDMTKRLIEIQKETGAETAELIFTLETGSQIIGKVRKNNNFYYIDLSLYAEE